MYVQTFQPDCPLNEPMLERKRGKEDLMSLNS